MYAIRSKVTGMFSRKDDDHTWLIPRPGQPSKFSSHHKRYTHEALFSRPLNRTRTFTLAGLKNSRIINSVHRDYVEIYDVLNDETIEVDKLIGPEKKRR